MCLYSRVAVAGWCRLAGDAFPSAGCRAWGAAGTCRCGRISSTLCRCVFVCGFPPLRLSGIPDLRADLWVAVRGGLCRWCGNRRLDAYLAGAVEMGAYSRVAVAGWCRLAGDAFPSAGCRAWGAAGTCRCGRILSVLSEVRAHPRVPVGVRVRRLGLVRLSCGCRVWDGAGLVWEPRCVGVSHPRCADTCSSAGSCGCAHPASWVCVPILWLLAVGYCGNRRLWVYFVGTVEMHAYLPVSAAAPFRHPGFARLSPGSCVIGAVPSPGQTVPARAQSPASR